MCLNVDYSTKKKVLKRSIKVWKILRKRYGFNGDGELIYSGPFQFNFIYRRNILITSLLIKNNNEVHIGLHVFTKESIARRVKKDMGTTDYSVFQMTIPKGASIYKGDEDISSSRYCIATNKLIWGKIKKKKKK